MKSFKSKTRNRGTTIILDNVQEAIDWGRKWYDTLPDIEKQNIDFWYNSYHKNQKGFESCVDAISKGDDKFKHTVSEIIDDILDLIDAIKPVFSLNRSGIKFEEEHGFTAAPELVAQGEQKYMISDKKYNEELEVKKGKAGEGAYRVVINTDVSWWGKPEDNCALVGALIVLLQRFATVEIWIQQGWIGGHEKDGTTLFKLDFATASDISALVFWICHPGKDIPFSLAVNRGLGRESSATSCVLEIEADLMLRGDWQNAAGLTYSQLQKLMYTERLDIMAKWIANTAFKIVFEGQEDPNPEWISEDRPQKPPDDDDDDL